MAHLWPEDLTEHLLARSTERSGLARDKAHAAVAKVRAAIEQQAPDDWRFTTSPHGVFSILYEPEDVNCRFLGRSFRDHENEGENLLTRLQAETVSVEELAACADACRRLILSPDCTIFHELKTCYCGPMDISEEKLLFAKAKEALGHVVLLDEKRIALRPNALVIGDELWVRQGEFFDMSAGDKADYREHLIFQRLRPAGIDKSCQRVYSFNRQAHVRFEREETGGSFAPVRTSREPGQRSQSYWLLPTRLDARYMDLCNARRAWKGDSEGHRLRREDMLLLARIEKLQARLRSLRAPTSQPLTPNP